MENGLVIQSHSRLTKHKPAYLRCFSFFHLPTSSPPFSKPLLSSTFLPLDPCFLNRSLSRRKPHNNPLSRLLWGLIFLLKNAIKTHNLATKTHKNSAKTLKNALFPLENASEQSETPLYNPETPQHWPHRRLNPGNSMANPGNRRHYKTAASSVSAVWASSVPYIKEGTLRGRIEVPLPQAVEKLGPATAGGGGGDSFHYNTDRVPLGGSP